LTAQSQVPRSTGGPACRVLRGIRTVSSPRRKVPNCR